MFHIALGRSLQNVAVVEMWCTSSSVVMPHGCEGSSCYTGQAARRKGGAGWHSEVGADVGVGGLFHFCAIYRHLR